MQPDCSRQPADRLATAIGTPWPNPFSPKSRRRRSPRRCATVESCCSAELVIAVRARTGSYLHAGLISGILAGLVALAVLLYSPWTFAPVWFLVDPLVIGGLAGLAASRSARLGRAFTPWRRRRQRVETAARSTFVERRVHSTTGRTGILLYVSVLEREAAFVVDVGVEALAATDGWTRAVGGDRDGRSANKEDGIAVAATAPRSRRAAGPRPGPRRERRGRAAERGVLSREVSVPAAPPSLPGPPLAAFRRSPVPAPGGGVRPRGRRPELFRRGSCGSGGGDGGGLIFLLFRLLFWLIFHHPLIGIPLTIALVYLFVQYQKRTGAAGTQNWTSAPSPHGASRGARPSRDLDDLRTLDPEFSVVLFEDFAYDLFARAHEARSSERDLEALSPYLSAAARAQLAQRAAGGRAGLGGGDRRPARRRPVDPGDRQRRARTARRAREVVTLEIEANMTVGAAGRAHPVRRGALAPGARRQRAEQAAREGALLPLPQLRRAVRPRGRGPLRVLRPGGLRRPLRLERRGDRPGAARGAPPRPDLERPGGGDRLPDDLPSRSSTPAGPSWCATIPA